MKFICLVLILKHQCTVSNWHFSCMDIFFVFVSLFISSLILSISLSNGITCVCLCFYSRTTADENLRSVLVGVWHLKKRLLLFL